MVVRADPERSQGEIQGLAEAAEEGGRPRKLEERGGLGVPAPARLVEGVEGLLLATQPAEGEAEVVPGLARGGVRVPLREPGYRRLEEGHAIPELAPPQEVEAEGVVASRVARVPLQGLAVVGFGAVGRVAVLLEMDPGQIELLDRPDLPGGLGALRRLGDGFHFLLLDRVGNEEPSRPVLYREGKSLKAGPMPRERRLREEGPARFEVGPFREKDLVPPRKHDAGSGTQGGGVNPEPRPDRTRRPVRRRFEGADGLAVRVLGHADSLVGHEVLDEALLLARPYPGEVGLVVGEDPRHQLDVGPVAVGEVPFPGLPELPRAPGPLLLPRRNVVVGDVQDARPLPVVVAADEVVLRAVGHVGGGHGYVPVAGDVDPGRVVDLVVGSGRDGKPGDVALAVVVDRVDVGREDRLVALVHRHGGVGPPEEALGKAGPVVDPGRDLDEGLSRLQGETGEDPEPRHAVDVPDPAGPGAVLLLLEGEIDRGVGVGPVVLGPVELDAARDPGSGEPDEGGLDRMVVVDEGIAVGLVVGALDPAPELGHDHQAQKLVLEEDDVPCPVDLFVHDLVDDGKGIDHPRTALIDPFFQEHGILVRLADRIGRYRHVLFPDAHIALGFRHRFLHHSAVSGQYRDSSRREDMDGTMK